MDLSPDFMCFREQFPLKRWRRLQKFGAYGLFDTSCLNGLMSCGLFEAERLMSLMASPLERRCSLLTGRRSTRFGVVVFWGDALFSPNCIGGDEYSTLRVVTWRKMLIVFIQIFLNGSCPRRVANVNHRE